MRKTLIILVLFLTASQVYSQFASNIRSKRFSVQADTIQIDSLLIVPKSVIIYSDSQIISDSLYTINYTHSKLILKQSQFKNYRSLQIVYRVFPMEINQTIFYNDINTTTKVGEIIRTTPGLRSIQNQDPYTNSSIQRNGSISRGLTTGNNQDAVVNSNLNLQLAGALSDEFNILAAISDRNIPLQPDGNTQQISDFDRVFVKIYNEKSNLIAGDFNIENTYGTYAKMFRKAQGGSFSTTLPLNKEKNNTVKTTINGSVSKGQYCRKIFNGQESNQGPYRLSGCNNELYIIIIAGSERVYINGELLRRGRDNDYTIDYNTGELNFTPNQPITKDSRIAIEFEYTEQSYARFLISNHTIVNTQKGKFWINLISEHDSKNQTLSQDLSDDQKYLLSTIGDNLDQAIIANVDSLTFQNDIVLYQKKDTLTTNGSYQIFEYSTKPNAAFYQVGFSFVGQNTGNYIQIESSANGRVFQWVEPINDIPQGNYEPIRKLVAPKSQQLINIGGDYHITSRTSSQFDMAISNSDINTFSENNSSDNIGYVFDIKMTQWLTKKDSSKSNIFASLNYRLTDKNFTTFERYKPVEFDRDWNIELPYEEQEQLISLISQYSYNKHIRSSINLSYLDYKKQYTGYMANMILKTDYKNYFVDLSGSILQTSTNYNSTEFIRYKGLVQKTFKHFAIGIKTEAERNLWIHTQSDSLQTNSYTFDEYIFFIENADSTKNKFRINYKIRSDYLPISNKLTRVTDANEAGFRMNLYSNPKNLLRLNLNYRQLDVKDSSIATLRDENSITGRLDYTFKLFKGAIISKTFYQIGSGLEPERDFSYIEVTQGQGVYKWTDYNSNNVKELDEFEIAHFQDEANYIRVSLPGSKYIKTYSNEFSEMISFVPYKMLNPKKKGQKIFTYFTDQFSYMRNQKNVYDDIIYAFNPFLNPEDSVLISENQSFRNIFSFNKRGKKFSADYIMQKNRNRNLLSNGFEEKMSSQQGIKMKIRITKYITLYNYAFLSEKSNKSEYFNHKNFSISGYNNEFTFRFEPGYRISWDLDYKYNNWENTSGFEKTEKHIFGSTFTFKKLQKNSVSIQGNYLRISYNELDINTPVANSLLAGLKPGHNFTWNLSYNQQLMNGIEINLSYNGRSSENSKVIHTGTAQIRAYF